VIQAKTRSGHNQGLPIKKVYLLLQLCSGVKMIHSVLSGVLKIVYESE
jgi:hypothetical protein